MPEINAEQYKDLKKKRPIVVNNDLLFYVLLLVFPIAQFVIFYIVVNFNSLLLSFQAYNAETSRYYFVGFDNFAQFWEDLTTSNLLSRSFLNSVIVWITTTLFGTVFAALFSYYIYKKRFLSKFFKFLLFLPSVLPMILLTIMFKFFANEAIPTLIQNIQGLEEPPRGLLVDPNTRFWVVLFFNVWVGYGSQVLLFSGAMNQIPPELIEAAEMDGASTFKIFLHVVVPHIMPTIGTFLVAGVAGLFINQANLWNFYGTGEGLATTDYTLGYYLFWLVNNRPNNYGQYPYASTLGLICTLFALPLTYLVRRFVRRWEE